MNHEIFNNYLNLKLLITHLEETFYKSKEAALVGRLLLF
jgi:hypothetical protein